MSIDLQKYCSTDPFREYLHKPFSRGAHTYATNGHIMLRLPRDDRYAEATKDWNYDGPLVGIEAATFSAPAVALPPEPPEQEVACTKCDGRGYAHDCPDCECECSKCDGKGMASPESLVSADFDGKPFQLRYLRMMLSLPGVVVTTGRPYDKPTFFKFDGGEGALMPMRAPYATHVELPPVATVSR